MVKQLTLIALLIFLALPSFVQAQTSYAMPGAFDLDSIVSRTLQPKFGRSIYNQLTAEGFYPIGWSRDGKFAYYTEPVDEACGCYFAELVIQDLRTDKVLWHFEHDGGKNLDDEGAPIEDDIRKLWKRNETIFAEKLREYEIVQGPEFSLLPKTFRSVGKSYTTKLTTVRGSDPDGNRRVRKLDLELLSPTLGKKSFHSKEYKGDDIWGAPLDSIVAGVFKSPHENRVAVVMLNVQRGWEGPPHTVNVQIAGADLVTGFRK